MPEIYRERPQKRKFKDNILMMAEPLFLWCIRSIEARDFITVLNEKHILRLKANIEKYLTIKRSAEVS